MIQYQNEHLTVFESALFQTTSAIIQSDDLILLVDPTWLPHEIDEIRNYVNSIRNGRELYLLFTHGDFDHIIGYQAFPDAITIGSIGLKDHPDKEKKVRLIHEFDHNYYIRRNYPILFPEPDHVIEKDGQQLVKGNTTITFYLSPGHSHDGLFAMVEPLGILIAGDYLSDFELPFIYDSAKAYKETLQKAERLIEQASVSVLVPGHGKATDEVSEMRRRIEVSQRYLERLQQAILQNDESELERISQEYPFPSDFTRGCHEENIAIMKRELHLL